MAEAFIAGAVRTPVGKRNGGLSGVHAADLAAHTLRQVVERSGVDPAAVDDVIMGCVSQIGPQTLDIGRNAWLSAGLPESVPSVTIDRQCGSSQQAVHFAAQAVIAIGCNHIDVLALDAHDRDVERSAAKVEHENGLVFVQFVETIG